MERLRVGDLHMRELTEDDAERLLDLRMRNRDFLLPWEPARSPYFHSLAGQRQLIADNRRQRMNDEAYVFGLFLSATDELIGRFALTNVLRGPCQYADLGYFVDQRHNGRGYATRAVRQIVRYGFERARLHRIQAGVLPRNTASKRVLEKAGFRMEGTARHYLRINGKWEDHDLYAIIRDGGGDAD